MRAKGVYSATSAVKGRRHDGETAFVTPTRGPAGIRAVCFDVDGTLTDGRICVDDLGRGMRLFDVHDGFAMAWYRDLGGILILCSGKTSDAVAARARELRITHVVQGSRDKVADLTPVLAQLGLAWDELAAIGDDLPELPLMRKCGYAVAVATAAAEVRAAADFVTTRPGGRGAVREALEHILRATGQWAQVLRHYGVEAGTPS